MADLSIAVLGTGANGASVGADLTRAGYDVTFIEQWPAHVDAMRANGVRVDMLNETLTTPVTVINLCEVAELRRTFDVVLIMLKAYDARWGAELIKPYVKKDGIVVGVQNGMTQDILSDVFGPERSMGCAVEISSAMFTPGVVRRYTLHANSWFAIGSGNPVAHDWTGRVAELLRHSGRVEVTDDIASAKWMKLVLNAAELVPTAIVDSAFLNAAADPRLFNLMLAAGNEALDLALASGSRVVPIMGLSEEDIETPHDFVPKILSLLKTHMQPDALTTVLQDWIRGRHSEVEEINGFVVRGLSALGRDAPANRATLDVARRIERGELTRGESLIEEYCELATVGAKK